MQQKPFAITLDVGTSHLNKTGSWRTERPIYVDRIPPCNKTCPAGENIQGWLSFAEEENYEDAWRLLMQDNPFPAIMGRVCYHPCEHICNRKNLDEAVAINSVERFIGEQGLRYGWKIEPGKDTGKKVMIIGAGPAGLATAFHLRRFGHQVTIFEASEKTGGMMRYGIPKYRLPREKLRAEIYRIEQMGVEIKLNTTVTDIEKNRKEGNFDAVLLGIGAQKARMVDIPNKGDMPVLNAIKILRDIEEEKPSMLSGRVVVYGGGNTAMDIARSAIRMGALEVTIIARDAENNLSAHPFEIKETLEEGAKIKALRSIDSINGKEIKLEVMISREKHQTGKAGSEHSGNFETMEADIIVMAIGQNIDKEVISKVGNLKLGNDNIEINADMSTSVEGIFAAGDAVPSLRSVTISIGQGKKAARNIDAYLCAQTYKHPPQNEVATPDKLETWYYSDAPRSILPILEAVRRKNGFAEVVGDLDTENAAYEARRCMSCGNCFECDNCYGVCPDNAIIKLGPGKGFEFKYDYCKGCGICEAECPCGAINMVAESI